MTTIIKGFNELTTQELYQILQLRVDIFVVEQNCPYPELDGQDQICQHYMMMENQTLCAYLRTFSRSDVQHGIGRIVTNEKYRGRGLGRKLIQKAIDDINKIKSISSILIHGQSHLANYYNSLGFEICSPEYLEDGIPHYNMIFKK